MCWLLVLVVAASSPALVRAHGRLMEPPARNSMWRLVRVRGSFRVQIDKFLDIHQNINRQVKIIPLIVIMMMTDNDDEQLIQVWVPEPHKLQRQRAVLRRSGHPGVYKYLNIYTI